MGNMGAVKMSNEPERPDAPEKPKTPWIPAIGAGVGVATMLILNSATGTIPGGAVGGAIGAGGGAAIGYGIDWLLKRRRGEA